MTQHHPALEVEVGGLHATTRDKDELIDVYRDAYADKIGDPFLTEERHWERVQAYAKMDGYALAEGRVSRRMVGCALGYRLPRNAKWWNGLVTEVDPSLLIEDGARTFALTYMMVRREYRRRGYAKALHDELLSGRTERRATLLVNPANTSARKAYDAWGWYKVGELQPFSDAPIYDAMLKDLP